ncbi:MAG: phospho-sugar mutase [Propionibacteriaceae bacterium]|nr:phospho-sugar mutase [Propionibacteriaceae bacterium]
MKPQATSDDAAATSSLTPALRAIATDWLTQDPDQDTKTALTQLLTRAEAGQPAALAELADCFAGPLTFGTAGLRAALGPGPARMNRVVVTQAAAGFADWLLSKGGVSPGATVLIGYDARHKSADFARDTAEVMAAAGLRPLLADHAIPTPVLAFGVVHLGCAAGVQVTASHNPAADNGYKVYLGDGSQIIAPTDEQIAAYIAAHASHPVSDTARSTAYDSVGDELTAAYTARVASLLAGTDTRNIVWAYTAMHGVGAQTVRRVVAAAKLPTPAIVEEQINPDPDFPTVPFPNPEEPGAMDLLITLADARGADIAIATDPDADRCAVAARINDTWRRLTGDEVGALLGDDALRRQVPGTFAASIVSSTLLGHMAAAAHRDFVTTLTGFKWIGRVPNLAFGYEEAIGYCCDPTAVRDKDGISAAAALLRLTAQLKADGQSICDRLTEIDKRYGIHATAQHSIRVARLSQITDMMDRLRSDPPTWLAGEPVSVKDLLTPGGSLPPTDGVEFTGPSVHVVVRPSGTEPKLKCYCEARRPAEEAGRNMVASRAAAASMLEQLWADMVGVLRPPNET